MAQKEIYVKLLPNARLVVIEDSAMPRPWTNPKSLTLPCSTF
ncbi:Beta-ketoadipate enol-lactone hydrolase [Pseudomonas sp. R2-60-08W]|nr:Beta-ketoadipate enol-lactone hydrolase [Pseudomonas sp. R3-52-08]AZF27946.1 Beta-ketoadipate enol-lactone hydrolase [Pseudomonas sp. R2-60-08W]